ncbi:hypothetical protein ATCC90586_004037 [Pythium insidiosum]|nr:hypothetical protein ATCC90586_004037 [Pythium insidiosum]
MAAAAALRVVRRGRYASQALALGRRAMSSHAPPSSSRDSTPTPTPAPAASASEHEASSSSSSSSRSPSSPLASSSPPLPPPTDQRDEARASPPPLDCDWVASCNTWLRNRDEARASPPPLDCDWVASCNTWLRNVSRLSRADEYIHDELFSPTLSSVHHALLFAALNAPQRVDVDVRDFLEGAKVATRRVLQDTNSLAFAEFVSSTSDPLAAPEADADAVRRCEMAAEMAAYCTPSCFQQLRRNVLQTAAKNVLVEALDVRVERACLVKGAYAMLTEDELEQELQGITLRADAIQARRAARNNEQPTLERLQLVAEVRTVERLKRTRRGVEEIVTDQRCVYLVQLTSRVTTPEDLDWRLASIAARTRGKAIEVSRRSLARPASSQN